MIIETDEVEFDPSALGYEELVQFLFARPVIEDFKARQVEFYGAYDRTEIENPAALTANATNL